MNNKLIIGGLVVAIALGAASLLIQLNSNNSVGGAFATSTSGASYSSAKWYATTLVPSVTSATTTGILNTDATDRIIQDVTDTCSNWGTSYTWNTGSGLLSAGFVITAGTSTATGAAGNGNTNYVLQGSFSTTSPESFLASTTPGQTSNVDLRRWPSGTYLNFLTNATNTVQCVIGVHTINA